MSKGTRKQTSLLVALFGSVILSAVAIIGCSFATPTATPPLSESSLAPTLSSPPVLATYTPVSLNDPLLAPFKKQLAEALTARDRDLLQQTASFTKWVGAIYREGGTPPIDPSRGLALTLNFLQENPIIIDIERTTYEPNWNHPVGAGSILGLVTPADGEPYYAHFYAQREPSAWRYMGIMTRIPYYDAPTVTQLRANPSHYAGKEFMYVGTYQSSSAAPPAAGAAPENATYVLETFAGPIWVVQKADDGLDPLPNDIKSHEGELTRVFGTVSMNNGLPFLEVDSFDLIDPGTWAHTQGTVESVDSDLFRIWLQADGSEASELRLTRTSFISLPGGTRGSIKDIQAGQAIDATGVPQTDGSLLVEALYISN